MGVLGPKQAALRALREGTAKPAPIGELRQAVRAIERPAKGTTKGYAPPGQCTFCDARRQAARDAVAKSRKNARA